MSKDVEKKWKLVWSSWSNEGCWKTLFNSVLKILLLPAVILLQQPALNARQGWKMIQKGNKKHVGFCELSEHLTSPGCMWQLHPLLKQLSCSCRMWRVDSKVFHYFSGTVELELEIHTQLQMYMSRPLYLSSISSKEKWCILAQPASVPLSVTLCCRDVPRSNLYHTMWLTVARDWGLGVSWKPMRLLKVILKDLGSVAIKAITLKFVKRVQDWYFHFKINPNFNKVKVKGSAECLDKIIS